MPARRTPDKRHLEVAHPQSTADTCAASRLEMLDRSTVRSVVAMNIDKRNRGVRTFAAAAAVACAFGFGAACNDTQQENGGEEQQQEQEGGGQGNGQGDDQGDDQGGNEQGDDGQDEG